MFQRHLLWLILSTPKPQLTSTEKKLQQLPLKKQKLRHLKLTVRNLRKQKKLRKLKPHLLRKMLPQKSQHHLQTRSIPLKKMRQRSQRLMKTAPQ